MTIHDGFTFGVGLIVGIGYCFLLVVLLIGAACEISDIYGYFKNSRQERARRALIEDLADKYRHINLETLSVWQLKILDDLYNYGTHEGIQFLKERAE
jgi:hypothetical protein